MLKQGMINFNLKRRYFLIRMDTYGLDDEERDPYFEKNSINFHQLP